MSTVEKIAMGAKPDPYNFSVKSTEFVSGHTIVLANYPGSLTFGGDKLMLLRGNFLDYDFKTLDPHFLDDDYAVVARFIPNSNGWRLARVCANTL